MTLSPRLFLIAGFAASVAAAALPAHAADVAKGQTLFKQRCAVCHTIAPGGASAMGPNLAGVSGRKSAATAYNYSPAMKKANLVWTEPTLAQYLAGPSKMVPGTKMVIAPLKPADVADLAAYVATLKSK